MLYVTGDTHGSLDYNKLHTMREKFTGEDLLLIAGDFGAVWHKNTLEKDLQIYRRLKCKVLFADGNHENFDLLESLPQEEFCGGKVHRAAENVYHLMRGQVFTLQGRTVFVMGGAESTDKVRRREGQSWWKQESVTWADVDEGLKNLAAHANAVDYVLTHTMPSSLLMRPPFYRKVGVAPNTSEYLLNIFAEQVRFTHWYFGHWHMDAELGEKYTTLYQKVIPLP